MGMFSALFALNGVLEIVIRARVTHFWICCIFCWITPQLDLHTECDPVTGFEIVLQIIYNFHFFS